MAVSKVLFLILLLASVVCGQTAIRQTVGTVNHVNPPLPEFLEVYQDVRTCFSSVFNAIDTYDSLRKKFDSVYKALDETCDSTAVQVKAWNFASKFFEGIEKIPLGALPKLSKAIKIGSSSVEKLFKVPSDKVCDVRDKLKEKVDKFDALVSTKVQKAIIKVNDAANKIDEKLDQYESLYQKYVIVKNQEAKICPSIITTFNNLKEWKESCENVLGPYDTLVNDLKAGIDYLENKIKMPLDSFEAKVKSLLNGPLGKIGGLIDQLKKVEVKLPNPRAKDRGVGKIPTCCPPGHKFSAGLCYPICPSGYETLAIVCMKRCPSGYKTLAFTCTKAGIRYRRKKVLGKTIKIPVPYVDVKTRHTIDRFGFAPAVKSKYACACRSDGRNHLNVGLCKRKCGTGAFEGYNTPILNVCWDFNVKTFKIPDLTKVLSLFDNLDRVPGIGDILKAANKIIDTVMKPIEKLVDTMFKGIAIPTLSFLPQFDIPVPTIDIGLADKIEAILKKIPLLEIEREELCVKVALV